MYEYNGWCTGEYVVRIYKVISIKRKCLGVRNLRTIMESTEGIHSMETTNIRVKVEKPGGHRVRDQRVD